MDLKIGPRYLLPPPAASESRALVPSAGQADGTAIAAVRAADPARPRQGEASGGTQARAQDPIRNGTPGTATSTEPPAGRASPAPAPTPALAVAAEAPGRVGAAPSAAFVTQALAQERVGAGLHIEPWREAVAAYERTRALGPAPTSLGSA
jgi:hypothetical protein